MDLAESFMVGMTGIQFYGLVFLLGSYTVSSLSDMRRLAAQTDFAEVWGLFTLLGFVYDGVLFSQNNNFMIFLKWVVIFIFAVIASNPKLYLRLSVMDVAAVTALFSILNPVNLAIAVILLVIVNEVTAPILKSIGQGAAYAFLPVVWIVNILIILSEVSGFTNEIATIL